MQSKLSILNALKEAQVAYLRLWFIDIMGHNKNVEVPSSQFEKALDGQILFDGSSIEGFARIEESDMLLVPDYQTFCIFPWENQGEKVARIICDIKHPDGSPFPGCPRSALKKIKESAFQKGFTMKVGTEAEFFLFETSPQHKVTTCTHDSGGYFDLTPIDRGEDTRRAIVETLEHLGFEVEAAHHECAAGQHEIDFKYDDVLRTADNIVTFRFVVRKIAQDFGLHATFMPKPIYGINGSGMHTHQSLFSLNGENAFYDQSAKYQISDIGLYYIGGLLKHAPEYCILTNPLVNSYKRLVPGYEAPTHIVWSERNRSPLVRVPARRGIGTRAELRMPDPSCNPYLSFSAMLASGLDGIDHQINPGESINKNIYQMSLSEKKRLKIKSLPTNLYEAIECFEKSTLMKNTLGDHISHYLGKAKRKEWNTYIAQVHPWEVEQYLTRY